MLLPKACSTTRPPPFHQYPAFRKPLFSPRFFPCRGHKQKFITERESDIFQRNKNYCHSSIIRCEYSHSLPKTVASASATTLWHPFAEPNCSFSPRSVLELRVTIYLSFCTLPMLTPTFAFSNSSPHSLCVNPIWIPRCCDLPPFSQFRVTFIYHGFRFVLVFRVECVNALPWFLLMKTRGGGPSRWAFNVRSIQLSKWEIFNLYFAMQCRLTCWKSLSRSFHSCFIFVIFCSHLPHAVYGVFLAAARLIAVLYILISYINTRVYPTTCHLLDWVRESNF